MDNLDALEHLRKARKYAAGLEEHKAWVNAIDDAIYVELICLAPGDNGIEIASAVAEWYPEYSDDEEFPWLEKIARARELIVGYEKAP